MKKFHVLVEWPDEDEQPWLVHIEAESETSARAIIERSDAVIEAGGKVVQIDEVTAHRTE